MRLVNTLGKGAYSLFGFQHSVLISGEKVLSYEMKTPLGEGEFKLYNYRYWKIHKIDSIEKSTPLKVDFNLTKYEGMKLDGYNCYEALEYICNKNGITMKPIIRTKIIIRWILIGIIIFLAGVWYGASLPEPTRALIINTFNFR